VRQLIADNKFEEAAAMLPQGTAEYIREVSAVCRCL
jgi:citrate lyase synthetase